MRALSLSPKVIYIDPAFRRCIVFHISNLIQSQHFSDVVGVTIMLERWFGNDVIGVMELKDEIL